MKLTKKIEDEIIKVYEAFWDQLLKADTIGMSKILDHKFRQIGTTEGEGTEFSVLLPMEKTTIN